VTTTMHVLPVGRSLLGRVEAEPALAALESVLRPGMFDPAGNPAQKVAAELARLADPRTGLLNLRDILIEDAQRAVLRSDDPKLCAEWTSVAVERLRAAESGAAYVLIASDTDDGLRSAIMVAGQYAEHVTYVPEPTKARDMRIEPGEVYLFRIPDLDLGTGRPNDQTWLSLGSVGHVIARTARQATLTPWSVVLHLTGGYKAMMPYLLVMAEGIRSVFKDPANIPSGRAPTLRAVSVHEHEYKTPVAKLRQVELPIRWVGGTPLNDLRKIADHTVNDPGIRVFGDEWATYHGQWITEGGGRLSEAGMIVTRVL
jgi:hypothetical protein